MLASNLAKNSDEQALLRLINAEQSEKGSADFAMPLVEMNSADAVKSGLQEPTTADQVDVEPPTTLDRLLHAFIARFCAGTSPAALSLLNDSSTT